MAAADESKTAGAATPSPVNELLASIPLHDFPVPSSGVITVNSDDTLATAVRTLHRANILAAPVKLAGAPADAAWHKRYVGVFDMTDVVWAALSMDEVRNKPMSSISEDDEGSALPVTRSFLDLLGSHDFFRSKTVAEIVRKFSLGPFVALEHDCNLLDAALVMGKYGQHRLMVVKPDGKDMRNVVTQSALVRYLAAKDFRAKLAPLATKTLAELGLGASGKVWAVDLDATVLSAFTVLAEQQVSAVAVLDAAGKIVGTVSNRDARVIATSPQPLVMLHGPVRSLFKAVQARTVDIRHPSITALPTDTLGFTIEKLAATRIHRVFVLNESGLPVGVVSLTDILTVLGTPPSADYFDRLFAKPDPAA